MRPLSVFFVPLVAGFGATDHTTHPWSNSEWVDAVDFDNAERIYVYGHDTAHGLYPLEVFAGRPYIISFCGVPGNGLYSFSAPDFMAASAVRKIQAPCTEEGTCIIEYKGFFKDVMMAHMCETEDNNGPSGMLTSEEGDMRNGYCCAETWLIPVMVGSYDVDGHPDNAMTMMATIKVKNDPSNTMLQEHPLYQEIDDEYDMDMMRTDAAHDAYKGGHLAFEERTVIATDYSFTFTDTGSNHTTLTVGMAYKLTFENGIVNEKHYFTAPEFFKSVVLLAVEDARFKVRAGPYFKALQIKSKEILDHVSIYFMPRHPGAYFIDCHKHNILNEAPFGMMAHIYVEE